MKTILITGGAGFIGSNFARYMLDKHPDIHLIILDALTYAGRLENIADLPKDRVEFVKGDIRVKEDVEKPAAESDIIINFAAETFVDKSITDPESFITTDILGVYTLLEAAKKHKVEKFLHISTDEVYGDIPEGSAHEDAQIRPNNPYSAGKAGGELLARSYYVTYGVPVLITRCSNNYGPYQHPEKFIPLAITNAIEDKEIPIYGSGAQIRDWIYVMDHCEALDIVLSRGETGQVYNISAGDLRRNIDVAKIILHTLDKPESLIKHVTDRPGPDVRYSIDSSKIRKLGWMPKYSFEDGLKKTIDWYLDNREWWKTVDKIDIYLQF